jgi:hypothetical protein
VSDTITLPRAEAEQIRQALASGKKLFAALAALDAALAEPEQKPDALRRDAERYRWLKSRAEDYDGHVCFGEVRYPAPIPDRTPFDAIDAAIDAAMQEDMT